MLLVLLLGTHTIFAQAVDVPLEVPGDSTYHNISGNNPEKIHFEQLADSAQMSVQSRSCVSTYTDQTVSSYIFILGCSTLTTRNITVTNSGNLTLSIPENTTLSTSSEVMINGAFDVLLGGTLNIGCEGTPPLSTSDFIYHYDASGNRIARELLPVRASRTALSVEELLDRDCRCKGTQTR